MANFVFQSCQVGDLSLLPDDGSLLAVFEVNHRMIMLAREKLGVSKFEFAWSGSRYFEPELCQRWLSNERFSTACKAARRSAVFMQWNREARTVSIAVFGVPPNTWTPLG